MRLPFHRVAILLSLAVLSLAVAPFASHASNPGESRQARTDSIEGFDYLVFETGNAEAGAELPLIVGLHYSGSSPKEAAGYFDTLHVPVRIVLPRGPYPRPQGHSWLPKQDGAPDLAAQADSLANLSDRLATFVDGVRRTYPTRGKPWVVGVSYGGDLAFLLALRHPDAFAAVFPIAARVLPQWMPATRSCNTHCPSIHALHGSADATVPMAPTMNAVEQLAALGFNARMTVYPGVAHDFNASMQQDVASAVAGYLVIEGDSDAGAEQK